jgi:hypothetical protein
MRYISNYNLKESTVEYTNFFSNLYYAIVGDSFHTARAKFAYWKQVGIACGIVVILATGLVVYRWYTIQREKDAQKIFAECLDQQERAESGDGAVAWSMMVDMWKSGYEQHKNSNLAPYFLAYAADACVKDGKMQEALQLFQVACDSMPKKSPLYGLYSVKRALMDGAVNGNKQGMIDQLQRLAEDTGNKQRDQALYYLGLSYWVDNDLNNATQAWQQLMEFSSHSDSPSPWAQFIEDKYRQLVDSGYPQFEQEQALFAGALVDQESAS